MKLHPRDKNWIIFLLLALLFVICVNLYVALQQIPTPTQFVGINRVTTINTTIIQPQRPVFHITQHINVTQHEGEQIHIRRITQNDSRLS